MKKRLPNKYELEKINPGKTYKEYAREAYPDLYHRNKIKADKGEHTDW